jgi:hypothetical protein
MGLNRAIEGARHVGQDVYWVRGDSTIPDLTGATLTGTIKDRSGNERTIESSRLTVTDATGGRFTWTYNDPEVEIVGSFTVRFKATYGDGSYELSDPETWIVEPAV